MNFQIRHQWLWWMSVLAVIAVAMGIVLTVQTSLAQWAVGKVKTESHAIFLLVGGLIFFLAEGPAKGLVDGLEKIQTAKEIQDVRLAPLIGRVVIFKKRALLIQDLLSYGRNLVLVAAAAIGQSVIFATLPPILITSLIVAAYTALLSIAFGTLLVRRWRVKTEDMREFVRVYSLRKSQEREQARAFLTKQASRYQSAPVQPTLEVLSAKQQQQ